MTEKPRVLFVCTHNAARSQMAEALLRQKTGHRFDVASAGLDPTEVHPLTREVLAELGLDPHGLYAKGTKDFLGRRSVRYAIIVCAQDEANCPRLFPFARQTLYWPCFRTQGRRSEGTRWATSPRAPEARPGFRQGVPSRRCRNSGSPAPATDIGAGRPPTFGQSVEA
jgi:protein-tyrosine-phosphatase